MVQVWGVPGALDDKRLTSGMDVCRGVNYRVVGLAGAPRASIYAPDTYSVHLLSEAAGKFGNT